MFILPELDYDFDALEPHIDAETMQIHHGKHHAKYVTNVNTAIEGTAFADLEIEELLEDSEAMEDPAIRNNAGGHFNHSLFWKQLSANPQSQPEGELAELIESTFESLDSFKEEFAKAAMSRFGSGWAWLVLKDDGTLAISSTPNQDNPLMPDVEVQGEPILGLDVWEHAYYLKYQNKRDEYIAAFWNVLDWTEVEARFEEASA